MCVRKKTAFLGKIITAGLMKSQVVHFFVLFCFSTVVLGNCLVQDVSGCKPVNQTQALDSALFTEARLKLVALVWLAPQWQYWISLFQDLLVTLPEN